MSVKGTVVVTGATGFIGSTLVRRLAGAGTRVVCPVRPETPRALRIASVPGVELVPVGHFDATALGAALPGCDAVIHLAAYGVAAGEADPVLMLDGNVGLTTHVLLAAKQWGARRFVFAGSCSEYAPAIFGERIGEDHPLRPSTLYGAAKAAAHVYARTLAQRLGVGFVGLRIFGTFGVGEAPARLIPHVIERLSRGEEPELTPGAHQRDLSYVDDVADALILGASHPGVIDGQAYNVCSGTGRSIAEVARRVAELMGQPDAALGLGRRPYRPDEPTWIVGDPERFHAATGYNPKVSLDDGIRRMIEASRLSL